MSDADKVWDLHKTIYKQLKKRANSLEGEVSKELKSYERNQRKYANRDFLGASIDELFRSIRNSQVVFLGDFHSFDQNTRNLERLTRELLKQKKKFSLGVELVDGGHQYAIELYLNHEITELEFLEEIEYHKSWRFPWSYYRPFFEMARKHNLQIIALNSEGNLEERDARAATIISENLTKNPEERFLILFGELHIVPNKLPKRLKDKASQINPNYRATIIHQNLDEVFWKIHEIEIEKHNQIVKFDANEFSLQTAPPWIKYESMIYWYENLSDDPEFELHDYVLNTGILNLHSNMPENFIFLCEKIRKTLDYDVSDEELEDFNLYEHQNLSLISDKVGRLPKSTLSNFYKRLISNGRVFRIPFSNNYYCSSYSINRISFICGLHLQDITIRKKNINYESALMEKNIEHKFVLFIKQHSIGYLASKVINPFRKCDLYLDFKEKFKYEQGGKDTLDVYKSLINIIESEGCEEFTNLLGKTTHLHIYEVARKLGFYFGEVLYEDFLIKGNEQYSEVFQYLNNDVLHYHQFTNTLRTLIPKATLHLQKKRLF
ncbi:MAG: ChaN family lipoprotein [Halobacteriovoraceae bacterium]|nr:ChaN family lipoprotein [Halobacteriovoraceae bacterium]